MEESADNNNSNLNDIHEVVQLSEGAEERLRILRNRYQQTRSLVMPALYISQEELGMINEEAIRWVSQQLDLPHSHVLEVATFYTMYHKKPVGKYHLQICRTLSCMLRGGREIADFVRNRFNIAPGEVTEDGMWSFEEVECLGSCGTAPVVQINDVFFELQTPESLGALIRRIEEELPDLYYSTVNQKLGDGLEDLPRSMLWQARTQESKEASENQK